MEAVLVLLLVLPVLTVGACCILPHRVSGILTAGTGIVSFVLALVLVTATASRTVQVGFLRLDALSTVFLLATSFLYATTGTYSVGYLHDEGAEAADGPVEDRAEFRTYSRRFFVGINLFAWSMLCAPAVNGLALLWIAIEITTVVSALLVAIDDTEGATEAAWKYVLIASSGLGIALLATIVMYYAGAQALGDSYDLAFAPLLAHAAELPATPVRLAFVLAVVGFGTKVGLFPVHTWLPDAHAEAPTPVSALLSGSLLAVSFYAILRFYQVAHITLGPTFPQRVLLVFGVLSLLLGALYVFDQYDIKRLLAYSSVEHMGILAIGVSFGAPLALTGVLLHVLAHAAAKGNAFMGAGVLVRAFGGKALGRMHAGIDRLPWSGPLFLMSIFALSGLPPFGLFRSEFEIVGGGLAEGRHVAAAILIVLVTLAFVGLTISTTKVLYQPDANQIDENLREENLLDQRVEPAVGHASTVVVLQRPPALTRAEPSALMVAPVIAGVLALIILGVHPPADLVHLLARGASELAGGRS